jgi:hypothetical protein
MLKKRKIPKVLWLSAVVFALFWCPVLAQMSSTNYRIPASVVDGVGAQKDSSTNYRMKAAGGQPTPTGEPKTSTNYKVLSGFTYTDGQIYTPGDVDWAPSNSSCTVNSGDIVYLQNYIFLGGPCPHPLKAGDVNCSCIVDSGDLLYLINYVFLGGPPPEPGCVDPDP